MRIDKNGVLRNFVFHCTLYSAQSKPTSSSALTEECLRFSQSIRRSAARAVCRRRALRSPSDQSRPLCRRARFKRAPGRLNTSGPNSSASFRCVRCELRKCDDQSEQCPGTRVEPSGEAFDGNAEPHFCGRISEKWNCAIPTIRSFLSLFATTNNTESLVTILYPM